MRDLLTADKNIINPSMEEVKSLYARIFLFFQSNQLFV